MSEQSVPYPRKTLYLILTTPMLVLYGVVAVTLWTMKPVYLVPYAGFLVLVGVFQSYVCAYWRCPYVGRFGPCVGGFCLPSSQIARLLKNVRRSERVYQIALTLAFANFLAVILYPLYFLYRLGVLYLLGYMLLVGVYTVSFLLLICPACATREVCPGGQSAMRLQAYLRNNPK